MLEEGLDGSEDIARDDVIDLIDLSLVASREVLLVFVVTRFDFVHTYLQQVTVGSEKIWHQLIINQSHQIDLVSKKVNNL